MIRYENHCCDCAAPGYPCLGSSCNLLHVPVLICDVCGFEAETAFRVGDQDVCEECFTENLIDYAEKIGLKIVRAPDE